MPSLCDLQGSPKIDYPNFWEYKIFLEASEDARALASGIVGEREHKLVPSKQNGKYKSYSLSVMVASERERLELFAAFKARCKFVL